MTMLQLFVGSMACVGFFSIFACIAFVVVAISSDIGLTDVSSQGSSWISNPSGELNFRADKWVKHQYPSDDNVFGDSLSESHWGTYQPDKYFAMKTRSSPFYLQSGIFWKRISDSFRFGVREDELAMMRYDVHDGKAYGRESLVDLANNMNITAEFALPPRGEHPTPTLVQSIHVAPITARQSEGGEAAYMYYFFGGGVYPEAEGSGEIASSSHNNVLDEVGAGGYSLKQVSSWAGWSRQSCLDAADVEADVEGAFF
jgi:hypothetical protein